MKLFVIIAIIPIAVILSAWLCSVLWEWAVVPLFDVRVITAWEAFKLQLFTSVLLAPAAVGIRK
jgi:hypothetical protein